MNSPSLLNASPTSVREFLESWPWFRELPPDLRALTVQTATEQTFAAGRFVARAGKPCEHWYGLMGGILQMYIVDPDGAETTLYCLREGEWGGDGSLLKRETRRYDLRALTASRVCLVPAATFEVLRCTSIHFNHFLCDIMNARMGEFVGMLEASRMHRPEVQVARALLMLVSDRRGDDQEFLIPQQELGLISGLSRQRVNIALNTFRKLGFVRGESHRGPLTVHLPRLRSYAMTGGRPPLARDG